MSYELLPPGFRFHPTDEELIIYYLQNQVTSKPCSVPIIPEVNIYKFDPWELPAKSDMSDGEWYFFTPRDRKYPKGTRPNRATRSGYWKATGHDKAIQSGSRFVGIKKTLLFYEGRPPRGTKSDWIMHEYRLSCSASNKYPPNGSMRLDDWVLCRIYKKGHQKKGTSASSTSGTNTEHEQKSEEYNSCSPPSKEYQLTGDSEDKALIPILPRSCSLAHLLESHDYISASQLFDDSPFCSIDDLFNGSGGDSSAKYHSVETIKLIGNQNMNMGGSIFADPIFQHC